MSTFGKVARLVSLELMQDSIGGFAEERTERTVFVDEVSIGAEAWMAARSAGLHADGSVLLRECEYHGEPVLVMEGIEYDVERSQRSGDFVRLTLARRLSNA